MRKGLTIVCAVLFSGVLSIIVGAWVSLLVPAFKLGTWLIVTALMSIAAAILIGDKLL